ncbi:MAG: DUF1549 and DUF1553 domain-containing protein [Planctomycetes bacterium]|nr:DUF1549 and DUF1553 domain-containing protein [Planctomycetota bacterium]
MISRKLVMMGLLVGAVSCVGLAVLGIDSNAQEAEIQSDKVTETLTKTPETQVSKRIDTEIAKVWKRDGVTPTKQTSDVEFVRRVYLDTVGVPPMLKDIESFLADKDKNKRAKLIDKLVASPQFGEHMGDLWTNILVGRAARNFSGSSELFAIWFSKRINGDPNFSNIMYDIVTAKGKMSENPAVIVYMREVPLKIGNVAGHISKTLAGTQIQCAECHDHPYEEAWTEEAFAGVASFFSPLRQNQRNQILPRNPAIVDDLRPVRLAKVTEGMGPEQRKRIETAAKHSKPISLDGIALKTQNRAFWRPAFAKWLTRDENTQTARYIANRFWSFTFGSGILNPIDDFNSFNEASHPELLEFLAQDLVDNDYDIKRLYRAILKSDTYQLSSIDRHKDAQIWHFAAAPVRQLSPEQFFGAFVQIAGGADIAKAYRIRSGDPFDRIEQRLKRQMKSQERNADDPNQRKVTFDEDALAQFKELFAGMGDAWYLRRNMAKPFATLGEDDEMTEADNFSVTIDQALSVLNGDIVNKMTSNRRGTLVWRVLNGSSNASEQVLMLYKSVLGREPSSSESKSAVAFIKESKNRSEGLTDLMFVLLATTEFQTNH